MQAQIVLRKIDEKWEGAIISAGKFMRAFTGKDLHKLVMDHSSAFLPSTLDVDTEVAISITINPPETKKNDE